MLPVPVLIAACLAALVSAAEPASSPPPTALHLEDVVQWHVAGVPPSQIIARIESSPVEFDLGEEMLAELRLAGLPDAVIDAMQARQAALHPTPAAAEPEADLPEQAGLVLRLRGPKEGEPPHAELRTRVPPALVAAIGLKDPEAVVSRIALYVACTTATHVPSHWRSDSPLGRDFATMPRHEMLRFEPLGTDPAGTDAETHPPPKLAVDLPASLEIALAPDEAHDLSVGVAVRIGDRYYRLDSDTWEDFVPSAHTEGIDAVVEPVSPPGVRIRFVRPGS